MQIQFFCPLWGLVPDYIDVIKGSLKDLFSQIKEAGYDGVEMTIPFDEDQRLELIRLSELSGLGVIAHQWAASGKSLAEYLVSYEEHLRLAAYINPIFINCLSGKDYFSSRDIFIILNKAAYLAKELGIKILHETHRGTFSFHAAITSKYFETYPDLRLTADFSHWCNVSESFLQDQQENVQAAIERTDHIHARVGQPQSPQVSDPRAPEWTEALNHHLVWWDAVISRHREKGTKIFIITPEFGPLNYMPSLPFTREPVASQWEINMWMKNFLDKRYNTGEESKASLA